MALRALSPIAVTAAVACAGLALPGAATAASRAHHQTAARHHRARTVSFYAQVVHSGPAGLMVRLRTGKQMFFSAHQLAHKPAGSLHKRAPKSHRLTRHSRMVTHAAASDATPPPVTVNILGLQPGVTVLVTETTNPDGSISVTITLPPASVTAAEQTASGVVGDVGNDTFDVQTSDGSDLMLHMAADSLSALNLQSCDEVDVTYHQDSELLIADTVTVTGASSTGDCQPTNDVVGTITAVSETGLTIHSDQGSMSFTVDDPSITDGFLVGDQVDVTYVQNADGTLDAQDVEYDEQDATGTVTAVSASSMTITDDSTGASDTFVNDPSVGVDLSGSAFDGVQVGDQVDVSYHVSNGAWVADDVSDYGSGGDSSGGDSSGGD